MSRRMWNPPQYFIKSAADQYHKSPFQFCQDIVRGILCGLAERANADSTYSRFQWLVLSKHMRAEVALNRFNCGPIPVGCVYYTKSLCPCEKPGTWSALVMQTVVGQRAIVPRRPSIQRSGEKNSKTSKSKCEEGRRPGVANPAQALVGRYC